MFGKDSAAFIGNDIIIESRVLNSDSSRRGGIYSSTLVAGTISESKLFETDITARNSEEAFIREAATVKGDFIITAVNERKVF